MSDQPYPEVTGDESGIVPPQAARTPSEWPKKLRTLTATELDRLTIDNSGRFYWDGTLVNYNTSANKLTDGTSDSLDRSMDILDRATYELGGHRRHEPATIEGELAALAAPAQQARGVDLDTVRAEIATAMANTAASPQVVTTIEKNGVALSGAQTLGAVIVLLCLAVGAIGMATYGYVAAVEWGCKTGSVKNGCPAPPKTPQRPDIPA